MTSFKIFFYTICIVLLTGCANYTAQFSKDQKTNTPVNESGIAHSFYLIGDAGNSSMQTTAPALKYLKQHLQTASKNATLVFLGDNVYATGIPEKDSKNYPLAKRRIEAQTDVAKNFKGNTIFIPGNHDWYNGLDGLKREEKLVEKALGKGSFLPENGCPLEKATISEDVVLIIIDTHWYVTNWNKHPNINNNCEIKTRDKFLEELEGLIKKARGKTTLIAMHHPMFSNGSHGGKYSFKSHLNPLPILGSLKNLIRKTSGISNTDLQNKKYNALKRHIVTLAQENKKTIFVSGHDHNLQYIVKDNLPQIVSGSGSKTKQTRLSKGVKFSYGSQGFAKLDIYKNGASEVSFYAVKNKGVVYKTQIFPASKKNKFNSFPAPASHKKASVYSNEEITKSNLHQFLWGQRYRKYFGTKVNAPTVQLDTLFGGLTPVRKGGGHQSKSLRLKDKQGREYVMRALRKNAVQYLQAVAFKDQYIEGQFNNTTAENLLQDVFTGSHPYAPFVIGQLSDAIGVYHTNPVLYYVPKQKTLANFNTDFGNELYMIEERAASGHGDKASFGFANKVISTDELLKKLNKNEKHIVDEKAYIRARLFDMLIGDWDRHEDQWRWAVFKEGDKTVYRPIPRDRDQAFSIMGNGALLKIATNVIPALRLMRPYSKDLKSTKWFNLEPYPLDLFLIKSSKKSVWDAQVQLITTNITDAVISNAFKEFPKEVQTNTLIEIKQSLQGRRKNLQHIADDYFKHINKFQVIRGTNKDDWFDIVRLKNGQTKITGYRIKKGKKASKFHQHIYDKKHTKEIWIYGLDDKDHFNVEGEGNNLIKIIIVGGHNNDVYNIINGKKIKIYDQKSKKNTFVTKAGKVKLTDNYSNNTYNHKKLKINTNLITPMIGFNPDDGTKIGFSNIYTKYGFERNPHTSQHIFNAAYYFATNGYEFNYNGEFANIFKNLNLGIEATFTSPNFAINYFGFGNNSINTEANKEDEDRNFNRVKIKKFITGTSLNWKGDLGAEIKLKVNYNTVQIENTPNRFIANTFSEDNAIFNNQKFINTEASYFFKNADNTLFTTMGIETKLQIGYTTNIENADNFGYLIPAIAFNHKITENGKLVLASKVKSHFNFGKSFEFYQAASIGGSNGLRGFRNERFTGKNAFYQSTDVRLNLRKIKTSLMPLSIGVYTGFDFGRVWGNQEKYTINTISTRDIKTSYGGGFFFSIANLLNANIAIFNSEDGARLFGGLGFNF